MLVTRGTFEPAKFKDKRTTNDGYVALKVKGHPNADGYGWVLEHRFVVSESLGRPLRTEETVHHINGVKNDNRLENLELWSSTHPRGQRVVDEIQWACDLLYRYAKDEVFMKRIVFEVCMLQHEMGSEVIKKMIMDKVAHGESIA